MSNLEATATVNNQLIGDTVTNDAGSPAVVLVPLNLFDVRTLLPDYPRAAMCVTCSARS